MNTKPLCVVAPLDGTVTYKSARNKGADAVLFVADVINDEGKVKKYAFFVSGGKMKCDTAIRMLENMVATQNYEHFAFINLMDISETIINFADSSDEKQRLRAMIAFTQALHTTDIKSKWEQLLFDSNIPEVDAMLRKMGVKH